jgi:hypothetical protein
MICGNDHFLNFYVYKKRRQNLKKSPPIEMTSTKKGEELSNKMRTKWVGGFDVIHKRNPPTNCVKMCVSISLACQKKICYISEG